MSTWLDQLDLDGEARHEALLLHHVLVAAFALNLASFLILGAQGNEGLVNISAHAVAGGVEGLGILAVRRGHVRLTAHVVVGTLLTMMVGMGFFFGGMASSLPFVSASIVVMAYYLLGVRSGAAAAAAVFGSYVAMTALAERLPTAEITPAVNFGGYAIGLLLTAAIVHAAIVRSNRYAEGLRTAQRAAEAERHKVASILATMREGVLVIGEDGRVASANREAERLLNRAASELVGTPFDALMADQRAPRLDSLAGVDRLEVEIHGGGGTRPIPVQLAMSFNPSPGAHGWTAVCTLSDISALKEAERTQAEAARAAHAANQTKSQFLANMSHELRTPLNAILGYSEMLAEDLDEDGLVEDVHRISAAGRHLLSLINDVLDLSKIEAGRMDIVHERVDLDALLAELVRTASPLAANTRCTLHLDLPEPLGAAVTDGRRVNQILLNLLSNACKFTEGGSITVEGRREAERLVLRVRDTGIGIEPEALARLFDPFVQADSTTSRRYGGTGLGLALSQRFAEMLDGTLTVASTVGEGSVFTLELPVEWAGRAALPLPLPLPAPDADAPLVLVIDDDDAAAELLSRTLASHGYRTLTAGTGELGLELARAHLPDAITLDIQLPGIDGWEVLAQLKASPETAEVPVILVTVVEAERRGYVMGAAEYLVKPVAREGLIAALGRLVHPPGTALVVEDDEATRGVLVRRLRDAGWAAIEAANGEEALAHLEGAEALPDAILLDLMMPVMDGFELAETLRGHARFGHIPVVVLTALDLDEGVQQRLSGVQRLYTKSAADMSLVVSELARLSRPPGGMRESAP